ncbi:hypothetical protein MAF45_05635 [Mesosutterella sp. OilRF-GAM-744-9]|uniref:PEGA domain-containing protein n=1 Tax=Mesosutterella porci TaxID=2915351 RepID=A0ABS9MQM9_9BURK|nr:hypothetical protein [Mesosutterella sp. oilRF-744-WT-GAM-9]MCG5030926.1 hypothetical protein [Mesosutterella sp. oilRF-744-WT-GAM-9]
MNHRIARPLVSLGAAAVALTGCATASFQFVSDPEGAVVKALDSGSVVGTTPFTVTMERDKIANLMTRPGCYRLPSGYEAVWGSGAKAASASPLELCDPGGSRDVTFQIRFDRPKDAPGLENDLRTALRNAQRRADLERARAEAAERDLEMMDGWGWGGWFGGPMFWWPPPRGHRPPPPPPPRGPGRR